MIQRVSVAGMTCRNCARHVIEALEALPGVSSASVDLATGVAEIEASRSLDPAEIAAALDDAGYALAK